MRPHHRTQISDPCFVRVPSVAMLRVSPDLRLQEEASPHSIWPGGTGLVFCGEQCAAAMSNRPAESQGFEQGRVGNEFGRIGIFSGTG